MEKLTITGIWRNDRMSKDNKPYVSLSMKTREYGDKYLSGFGGSWNSEWKVGSVVEVEVEKKNTDKDGKPLKDKNGNPVEYLNFDKPDPIALVSKAIMNQSVKIIDLTRRVEALEARLVVQRVVPGSESDIDIPVINDPPVDFDEDGTPIPTEPDMHNLPF